MAEKRPPLPIVLTAQRLRDGVPVYWDGAGWAEPIEAAQAAADDQAAARLEAVRDAAVADGGEVIDVFLFALRDGDPAHFRERARLTGPSFRDDYGRNGGVRRVSL